MRRHAITDIDEGWYQRLMIKAPDGEIKPLQQTPSQQYIVRLMRDSGFFPGMAISNSKGRDKP